jgi:hypothetical protein
MMLPLLRVTRFFSATFREEEHGSRKISSWFYLSPMSLSYNGGTEGKFGLPDSGNCNVWEHDKVLQQCNT